ncbi:MAG: ferritin-like domain-containing protein [Pseudomonadota bacterium]
MTLNTLKDVYIDQLQDIYSADKQSLKATKDLVEVASDNELKSALERGVDGIQEGMDTVGQIIKDHGEDPTGEFCKGMEGLVKEVKAHVLNAEFGEDEVRDAMIITQYQRMTHYGIAGYGCLVAFAKRLGLHEDAQKLQTCLDNTYSGDQQMTRLAENGINQDAVNAA